MVDRTGRIGWSQRISGAFVRTMLCIVSAVQLSAVRADVPNEPSHWAGTETINGLQWQYAVSNGVAEVTSGTNRPAISPSSVSGVLVVPSTLGGYPVTTIGDYAFAGCRSLNGIAMPPGVTRVLGNAFATCTNLRMVDVSDLTAWCRIGFANPASHPFYASGGGTLLLNGNPVDELRIPEGTMVLNSFAFRNCTNLTSVTIPAGVTRVGSYVFANCISLTNVTMLGTMPNYSGTTIYSGCPDGLVTSVTSAWTGPADVWQDRAVRVILPPTPWYADGSCSAGA